MGKVKTIAREAIGFVLRFSGASWVIRSILCRKKVTILVYHDPDPETFERHMEYLGMRYEFIAVDRLVSAIEDKTASDIPRKALIVTCDDGRRTNYELLDTLKAYNIRATFYLCSHLVGTNRHFWFSESACPPRSLKKLPTDVALQKLRREQGYEVMKEYAEREVLCKSEILEMAHHVDFGSHTKFHPVLPQCKDGTSMEEIRDSKESLDMLLDKQVKHFAYPCGDYGEREIEFIKRCGYRSARTIDVGWNDVHSDPYRLKAIGIEDNASINVLCGQLTGLFTYLNYVWHGSFKGIRPPFV